jgi:ribonuclease E
MARHERQVEEASSDAADAPGEPAAEKFAEAPRAEAPPVQAPPVDPAPASTGPSPETADETADEKAETAGETAAEAPPAEPEKPKVVTRTRRRSASRPAGPPSGAGTISQTGVVEPGTAGLEPDSGTPSGEAATPAPVDGADTASGVPDEAPVVEHVPIKKKGSRKR